eukprot:COSAG02_NODE_57367_length_281_cov_0.565934_1_plen_21_part_10
MSWKREHGLRPKCVDPSAKDC